MINPTDLNTTMFNVQGRNLDKLNSYANLNTLSAPKQTQDESLRKAASEFEAVFVAKFLDVVDSTIEKGEFLHGGQAEGTFKSMLNQQMAVNIAENPRTSFGFAEQIYRQMKDRV